jgi:hypothetical protein
MQETRFLPHAITEAEWRELAQIQEVKEMFGLEDTDEDGELLASCCYGARFKYMNGSPGYIGDLFVLISNEMGGPFFVTRNRHGRLVLGDKDEYLEIGRGNHISDSH